MLGVRAKRADNLARRAAGRGWHGISRLVLKYHASDVDCGFKLLHRTAIGAVAAQLQSDYAAISPELLARLYRAGHRFVEVPVPHYPRMNGKQSGLKPEGRHPLVRRPVHRSTRTGGIPPRALAAVRDATRRSYPDGCGPGGDMTITEPTDDRQSRTSGPTLSAQTTPRGGSHSSRRSCPSAPTAYFASQGMALGYEDSISHLQIAARTLNSPTAGFAQLGGVWLPLPHILMLPLIWIDAVLLQRFRGQRDQHGQLRRRVCLHVQDGVRTDARRIPALAGSLVFALNPNVLYMQSTPMTELLLFASMAATVYYAQKWIQTDDHNEGYPYLFAAAVAAFIGCLTRYEAWASPLVMGADLLFAAWRKYGRQAAEGLTLLRILRRRGDCAVAGLEPAHLRQSAQLPERRVRQAVAVGGRR